MSFIANRIQKPPGIGIWVSVTLLWGTVFYWTSIFMLRVAAVGLDQGFFNPSWRELLSVYGVQIVVLVVVALLAMWVRNMLDPGSKKQMQRWQNISEGKGEKIFISFAGSIATSFFFTTLTALTFRATASFLVFAVDLTPQVVLLAALFNIVAGLAASLLVGLVFILAKIGRKRKV